jgi:hypothetical protein
MLALQTIPVEAGTFGNEAITVWTPQTWASASTVPGRSAAGNIKHLTSSHTWLFAITADISALQSLRRSCVDDAGESMKIVNSIGVQIILQGSH